MVKNILFSSKSDVEGKTGRTSSTVFRKVQFGPNGEIPEGMVVVEIKQLPNKKIKWVLS